jgi:alkylated DNA repair dioxygenase AlkB
VVDTQGTLFDAHAPEGFFYRPDFISADEEAMLVEELGRVEFAAFEMRGVVARRRVAFFGRSYEGDSKATPPIPAFLIPLRDRAAAWADVAPTTFVMALVNDYPAGAPIGWHRDAPQYDIVAGISLLSACRMKFRPYVAPGSQHEGRRTATHDILLEPRSGSLLTGTARRAYEHHIPAVPAHRYSVTFRTPRAAAVPDAKR